jgi:transcriptional regulator with XRE-family HTH domain
MVSINKIIGQKISQLRNSKGISQQKLAELLEVSRPTITQIEKGNRYLTPEELLKLSKIFNTSLNELINPKVRSATGGEIILESGKETISVPEESIRISIPQKNLKKFREVLLYILNKIGAKPNIGETVLYKLLFYIDFDYYERYEEQLIGATYIKNHHGPTPKEFVKIVEKMEKDKEITRVKDKYFDYPQTKYLPLREPDLTVLNGREKELIDEVLNKLSDMNAAQISEYSHNDVPWLTTNEGKVIHYESVFYRTVPYSVRNYAQDIQ